MPQVKANGLNLAYKISGPANGQPLLLIHGLGGQLIQWPQPLCDALIAEGFMVIRFDNRDVGLSTHLDGVPIPDIAAVIEAHRRGETPNLPYTVSDMADDAAGLLSALGIARAHVFGVSLGGMIAQALAIGHPERVLSLAILMSHTGNPDLPLSDPKVLAALTTPAPNPFEDEAGFRKHAVALGQAIGSPGYPIDATTLEAFFLDAARRSYDPLGVGRQFAASRGAADRRTGLRRLVIPTLVMHGTDDLLIPIAGGEDIARNVEGALMLSIRGLGHDLPPQLADIFARTIHTNVRRAHIA